MAVFLVNTCKFNGCGLTYATLSELIQHIEETHLDTDPQSLEKQESQPPPSLALSYVFRVFTDAVSSKEKRPRLASLSPVSSLRSATPTGSEFDEDDGHSSEDDSDDSWTTQEEFTSELILSMMANSARDSNADKPFACPVPGCKKRYKNINGIKYHAKHGHKKEVRVKKPYKCKCGKSYKTSASLQTHSIIQHQVSAPSLISFKPKAVSKPKQKQSTGPKPKLPSGLGNKLPVAALVTQAHARKQVQASLKSLATSLPQAILTAANNGPPHTTALVTVPVTFGKPPAVATLGKEPHRESALMPPHHMLNLIAPSGLVPPGTTITVPMEQITRNLTLLQQISRSNGENLISGPITVTASTTPHSGAAFTVLSSHHQHHHHQGAALSVLPTHHPGTLPLTNKDNISSYSTRLIQSMPELTVPNCMLSEEAGSPFTFTESGFEEDDRDDDEVDMCFENSHNTSDSVDILSVDSTGSQNSLVTDSHRNQKSLLNPLLIGVNRGPAAEEGITNEKTSAFTLPQIQLNV